ncbi:La ribonucleoprotein domain member 1B [Lunasporangiospora selenospora]|uniref:La ribonucleoprotein domain member 1B n=1 Tax=Lunasporangiospora selenospora TaxID=979761 RepID=A0A9P6FNA9_9FUNG|nr:La ribonucleoprotein domain member 1B [Lunasporangiospora selenospora]
MVSSTVPAEKNDHAQATASEPASSDNHSSTTVTTAPPASPAPPAVNVWAVRKEAMKPPQGSQAETDADKGASSTTEGSKHDAKEDGKKSKKNKKHGQQQALPSLDDTNVWPDPSASAEKESKQEPAAAAPLSKKDKGKWTQVTPNITHSTPAPGANKGHDAHHGHGHHRRRKNSTGDGLKANGHSAHEKTKSTEASATTNTNGSASTPAPANTTTATTTTSATGAQGRRASVPSIFDEEPTQSQRSHNRQSSGRGRGGRTGGGRPNYRASVGNVTHLFQQGGFPQGDPDVLKSFILQQMEYYFSVENLCKDVFMRNQMDSDGYVPLSLVANFNRVKGLTTDTVLIKETIKSSKAIELSGDRIRKRGDWATWIFPKEDGAVPISTQRSSYVPPPRSPHPVIISSSLPNKPTPRSTAIHPPLSPAAQPKEEWVVKHTKPKKHGAISHPGSANQGKDSENADDDDEVFQFDDDNLLGSSRIGTVQKYYVSDDDDEDEDEFDDDTVAKILIVTQKKRDRSHVSYERKSMTDDLNEMINEGLYHYEKDLQRKRNNRRSSIQQSNKKVETISEDQFAALTGSHPRSSSLSSSFSNQHIILTPSASTGTSVTNGAGAASAGASTSANAGASTGQASSSSVAGSSRGQARSKKIQAPRFYPLKGSQGNKGGKSDSRQHFAQAPVGWVLGDQSYLPTDLPPMSIGTSPGMSMGSFNDSSMLSTSMEAPHSFPSFQHPSHELLHENGFIQHKYYKYHYKALKERKRQGIELTYSDFQNGHMYGLEKFWAYLYYRKDKSRRKLDVMAELKPLLEQYKSIDDFKNAHGNNENTPSNKYTVPSHVSGGSAHAAAAH